MELKKNLRRLSTPITQKKAPSAPPVKKVQNDAMKKLKILFTVVDRSKTLFYTDLIEQFEVNMQTVIYGKGTADSHMLSYLGLSENDKAIIVSVVREDKISNLLETLNEKFDKIKNGKGIAFTVPMKSVIGVSIYQFLSNQSTSKKGE